MENLKTFFRMFKQLNTILPTKEKKKFVLIILMSIVGALLETLGISAILPLILALLQPSKLLEYSAIEKVLSIAQVETEKGIVVFVACGVIAVFFLKNFFLIVFGAYKYSYQNRLERDLSKRMCKMYIMKPYTFFLDINSAEIEKGVSSDTSAVSSCVNSFCVIVNEILTCCMLGIALIIINPVIAVVIVIMAAIIVLVTVSVLRKRTSEAGERTRVAYIDKTKKVLEIVGGIKEIIVMKRYKYFFDKYSYSVDEACNWNTEYLTLSLYPRALTETTFVIGLVIVIVATYLLASDTDLLMAQFASLAVAAVRILPATSNILNAVNALVFHRPYLENAYEIITSNEFEKTTSIETEMKTNGSHPIFNNSLVIDRISWKYDNRNHNVIDELSLEISKGQSIGIIGGSGAGKTTLIDIILGILRPQEGSITVDGKDIYNPNVHWEHIIGYVPQTIFILDDTVRGNILFGVPEGEVDELRLYDAIKKSQLDKFVDELPNGLNTMLGEKGIKISGGQRQRIAIARALYTNPEILVMDEATSALDTDTEEALIEAINALKGLKTLIIVAHRLSTLDRCDCIYKIENGKAVLQKKEEVLN